MENPNPELSSDDAAKETNKCDDSQHKISEKEKEYDASQRKSWYKSHFKICYQYRYIYSTLGTLLLLFTHIMSKAQTFCNATGFQQVEIRCRTMLF